MKKIIITLAILVTSIWTMACPTCEVAQPRYLKGISHGTGPQSNWDLVIIAVTAVIVIGTLFFTIKWIIRPGEKSASHIKQLVLNLE